MKFALVTLFALFAVAHARIIDQIDLEDITAYDYLAKYGLPRAEEIRKAEEEDRSRIVGGSPAAAGAFPYQAGLLAQFGQGQGVCGASLITSSRLVTAAHCWFDGVNQAISYIVVLGSTTLYSGGIRLNTNQVVMHNQWNPSLIRNDIAIIRLTSNVGLSNNIAPIALASGSDTFAGENAVTSGFGLTSDGGSITTNQQLSHVTLPVITNAVCFWSYPFSILASNICTSGANGRSTCSGDSGGPLVVHRSGRPLLVKGIHNLQSHHACFGQFLTNKRVLDIVEDLMECPNIMLHHTKAHYKPPSKGALYPMHQDYPYFPYVNSSPIAAFVHLDAANPENGGLHVYPGSHKLGPLPDDESAEEDNYHFVDKKRWPLEKATPVVAERGDVVFFSCLLIHGSSHNTSTRPRRMYLAQFVSADDRFIDENVRVQPGYGWMLRGVNFNKNESTAERFSHT